jgi:hypothetical protein
MKAERLVKKVSARLDVLRFPVTVERSAAALCLNCSSPLSLTQPDLKSPDRLLGVCEQCKHWFLIDLIPDMTEGIMCRLPPIEVIRSLSHENPSEGISLMGDDQSK